MRQCWRNMLKRCYNKSDPSYKYYGGRGIKVCSEWKESFPQFYEDMFDDWQPGLSIDRINPKEGYNKKNCRWITQSENSSRVIRKGRPRLNPEARLSKQVACHVTMDQYENLVYESYRRGISVSHLLTLATEDYLEREKHLTVDNFEKRKHNKVN